MTWAVIIAAAFVAGIIQTVTGFGAAVFMMLILPYFFSMVTAPAVTSTIALGLSVTLAWKFRKHIQWKICALPTAVYTVCSIGAIQFVKGMDLTLLSLIFGGFLVALAVYFFLVADRISLRPNWQTATVCGAISGVTSGLFGIGGPLMAIFFISSTEKKEDYIGSIQFLFAFTNIVNLISRVANGIYTLDLVPATLLGIGGITLGKLVGLKILDRINGPKIKKLVYGFVGISGIITLLQQL